MKGAAKASRLTLLYCWISTKRSSPKPVLEHRTRSKFTQLSYAYDHPVGKGQIRTKIADFKVEEKLGFELNGSGEHVFLKIEKQGETTDDVAKQLAICANVRRRDIGFAGLKDKNAVAIQWFSVHLPGKDSPDWKAIESESIRLIEFARNYRKLRRGALASNSFEIVVRNLVGTNRREIDDRLKTISQRGVPNYFGPQRFGFQEQNIEKAEDLFRGKLKIKDCYRRGLYLSAARAHVFNQLLSERVAQNNWNRAIPGDAFMLEGSRAFFKPEIIDGEILRRLQLMDIHPSGVLWGKGKQVVTDEALTIEENIVQKHSAHCEGLRTFGLEMDRRSLRLNVATLQWELIDSTSLGLRFMLSPGAYATSVLRELVDFSP